VLISPEQLLSRTFVEDVLKDPEFKQRLLSVVIDEAHVISHWGSGFRKKYGELGIIRSFLLKSTPIIALSATLPARV
jgi:superfamily II DNA helicase RecQ